MGGCLVCDVEFKLAVKPLQEISEKILWAEGAKENKIEDCGLG